MTLTQTEAEKNHGYIMAVVSDLKTNFIQLGLLLMDNYKSGYWSQLGHESFNSYVEQLGIGSYSTAMRLVEIAEFVTSRKLEVATVHEIGISKTMLLLPVAKKGELTDDMIELARNCTNRDLREHLGHKIQETDKEYCIDCPRCGVKISGVKYVRKDDKCKT